MFQDVLMYIKSCHQCQLKSNITKIDTPSLHPVRVQDDAPAFSLLGIDLVGKLPKTKNGNEYICVISCYVTKWTEAYAIANKSADSVYTVLIDFVCHYGVPESIISDQGREFCNQLSDSLCEYWQIKRRICTAYHPQSNGLTERFNQTLCNSLIKYLNDKHDNWEEFIPLCLFGYRTSIQKSTKLSPYFLVFGQNPRLPTDLKTNVQISDEKDAFDEEDALHRRMEQLTKVNTFRELGKLNNKNAQNIQKQNYDKLHSLITFAVKDKVIVINKRREGRMGDKFSERRAGPYTVSEVLPHGVYKLEGLKALINGNRLVKYIDRSDNIKRPPNVKRCNKHHEETLETGTFPSCISSLMRKSLCKLLNLSPCLHTSFGKFEPNKPPYRLYKTKGDGNCFFRAISFCLSGSENSYHVIRDKVVQHMSTKIKNAMTDYLNKNISQYLLESGMVNDKTWATDAEIIGCASLLGLDIKVFAKHGETYEWVTFPASLNLSATTIECVFLDNSNGNHFDVVLSCK